MYILAGELVNVLDRRIEFEKGEGCGHSQYLWLKRLNVVVINGDQATSRPSINMLGVNLTLDYMGVHVSNAIKKAKKALHAIRFIKKFFNKHEII